MSRPVLTSRHARADWIAVAVLCAIPILVDVPPSLFGHPLLLGDNFTQNYPLRVLSGELLRHGHLPLWNPYIWSGTQLLAGWNAGSLYPGTWLFAILPGVAAWTVNLVAVGLVAGVGLFAFLRRLGASTTAAFAGGVAFSQLGFMAGQAPHIGLVQGMSLAPVMLLAVHGIAGSVGERPFAERAPGAVRRAGGYTALLGLAAGMSVLAGDPRSVSNDVVVVGIYAIWCIARATRARTALLTCTFLVAAAVETVLLSAPQWLPGLSFLHHSQRGATTLQYFQAGALGARYLPLAFLPFGLGGYGNLGMTSYVGPYNLPEVTFGMGTLALVALVGLLLPRLRQMSPSPVAVWYVTFLAGVALAGGPNTALGNLLVKVPLYSGERLQNRNAGIADLAGAILLALFIDALARRRAAAREGTAARAADRRLTRFEQLVLLLPSCAVALLAILDWVASDSFERLVGVSVLQPGLGTSLSPYLAIVLVEAVVCAALVLAPSTVSPSRWRAASVGAVGITVVTYLGMANYAVVPPQVLAATNGAVSAVRSAMSPAGRYAIYDPRQFRSQPAGVLNAVGFDDLGILHRLASVQGYGSALGAAYNNATQTHRSENLRADALLGHTFDTLGLQVLATIPNSLGSLVSSPRGFFFPRRPPTPTGHSAKELSVDAAGTGFLHLESGPFLVTPSQNGSWLLPGAFAVKTVNVRLIPFHGRVPRTVVIALVGSSGGAVFRTVRVHYDVASWRPPPPSRTGAGAAWAVLVEAVRAPVSVGAVVTELEAAPASIGAPPGSSHGSTVNFLLNGALQGLLPVSRWRYHGHVGDLVIWKNLDARVGAWLEAPAAVGAFAPEQPGFVDQPAVPSYEYTTTVVSTPHPALLVRGEAYESGWSAGILPLSRRGPEVSVPVQRVGLVQGVELPPGKWIVTWHYRSARAEAGVGLALLGTVALIVLVAVAASSPSTRRRRRRRPGQGRDRDRDRDRPNEPTMDGPAGSFG